MQTTSTRPLWPLHAFAIPLLAVLGWLIYDEKSRDFTRGDTESLARTLMGSRELIGRSNQEQFNQIEKKFYYNRNPYNEEWLQRAKQAVALGEKARKKVMEFYGVKQNPNTVNFTGTPVIQPDITALADSLIALFGGDSSVAVRVRTCLFDENINTSPEWWSDVLRQNSKETMELWCCNLLSKITLAEKITLQYIVPKIRKTDYLIMDAFEINLLPKRTPVHPGELFEADVWLTSYSTHTDNIRMFANEKQLPIENGKAVFNQIYQAAGMKTVDVRIEIHNPLTGEVYNIEKEFNMVVRPKCAPKD